MIYPIEQLEGNLLSTEHQLLYKLYMEQKETNRLLTILVEGKDEVETNDIDHLKRPQLMQLMAKLPNKPQGFHKWETETIRKHLKEVS